MKTIRVMAMLGMLVGLLAISAQAQSVQTDYDKSVRLANLKTFTFMDQRRGPADPLAADSLNDNRIRTAIESQLLGNGLRTEENADFAIAYYVTTKNKLSVQDYGYGPPRWFGSRDIRVNQDTEGTLMVDFIDLKTNQVIWRGRASGILELKNVEKKINKSVEKLVKQFVKDTQKQAAK